MGETEVESLVERALAGDRRSIAKVLSLTEQGGDGARAAMARLHPRTGHAWSIGITGAPGAGKSTLTDQLIGRLRATGAEVGVLAVDPTSPFSGGAILGDRVRMQSHTTDPGVFIRSMATRGHAGGLAAAAADAAAVLDAVGFPVVFLETVGTGQSEVEVAALADTTVVAEAPEMGDEVQAIKAGLLEVADMVVVTKGDRPGAQRTAAQLRAMLSVGATAVDDAARSGRRRPKRPAVMLTAAATGEGVAALLEALDRRAGELRDGSRDEARMRRATAQMDGILVERLHGILRGPELHEEIEALVRRIAAYELDPYAAADRVIELLGAAR